MAWFGLFGLLWFGFVWFGLLWFRVVWFLLVPVGFGTCGGSVGIGCGFVLIGALCWYVFGLVWFGSRLVALFSAYFGWVWIRVGFDVFWVGVGLGIVLILVGVGLGLLRVGLVWFRLISIGFGFGLISVCVCSVVVLGWSWFGFGFELVWCPLVVGWDW